jgi:N-acetylglucosaminyldiphosphoundecaprenol N-acetyl-beta-D-mannosaminyltransferase
MIEPNRSSTASLLTRRLRDGRLGRNVPIDIMAGAVAGNEAAEGSCEDRPHRRRVYGVNVDVIGQTQAVSRIMRWCQTGHCGIVVTPNLDHVVKLQQDERLRRAYDVADLILADGLPLVLAARLDGGPRLKLVTGSDLIDPICAAAAREGFSVFFLGSSLEVLASAADLLSKRNEGLRVTGMYSPPMGFELIETEKAKALRAVNAAAPDIVFLALGAPKSEIWATTSREAFGAKAILCIGAGLDFVAGKRRRAPRVVRKMGLEWVWRLLSEPRRLHKRYITIILWLPILALRHFVDVYRGRHEGQQQIVIDGDASGVVSPATTRARSTDHET